MREIRYIHTSAAAFWTLRKSLVLPVVKFLLLWRPVPPLLLLLLFAFSSRAGSAVARLAGSGLDSLAFIIGQISNSLGEGQQHLTLDGSLLRAGATGPTAGLPGTGNEAAESRQEEWRDLFKRSHPKKGLNIYLCQLQLEVFVKIKYESWEFFLLNCLS